MLKNTVLPPCSAALICFHQYAFIDMLPSICFHQ